MTELVMLVETGVKLNETIGTVEELSTWHDERTREKEEREASNVQRVTL